MKLSVEAKVAAAVGAGFVALTVGAIAQGNGGGQTGGTDASGPGNNPGVQVTQQRYNSSLAQRTRVQDKRHKFSSEDNTAAATNSGKKANNIKARKHHTPAGRQIERI